MSRTVATFRLYGAILYLVVAVLAGAIRETLPSTEDEAGSWIGGFCWAFCLHWVILILVTLAWYGGHR